LLVDDNPADVDLTREILGETKPRFHVTSVKDGVQALRFLRNQGDYGEAPAPDLLVLDLNLPRKDGLAVLSEIKSDSRLSKIPVVIFSTSQAGSDIQCCYELGANCYLRKPGNLNDYRAVVQALGDFWLGVASLPKKEKR
jgi:two-component system, chemotaxis family, response regulator Rcp1